MKKGQKWSQEHIKYVVDHYPFERAEDVGNAIGRSVGAVMHMAHSHGVHKDKEALSKIMSVSNSGANSGNFKGYVARSQQGYILRYVPDHPNANFRGYIGEHRLVAEKNLGFVLPKSFVVHHINGVKDDNRIENLAVMTIGAHSALHGKKGRNLAKGDQNPKYKNIDVAAMVKMREQGQTIKQICERFNICKYTFYKKVKEWKS